MYIEKLSLSNIREILSKLFDNKNVKIKKIDVKGMGHNIGSFEIDFEVLKAKYKSEGFVTGNLTMTDYYVSLNEFDEINYGLDEKLNKKYHKAMIEEFEKIGARKATKDNLAEKYRKDVDFEEVKEENLNVL